MSIITDLTYIKEQTDSIKTALGLATSASLTAVGEAITVLKTPASWKLTYTTPTPGQQTSMYLGDITNIDIDWGDGSAVENYINGGDPEPVHTYADAGTYVAKVSGVANWIDFGDDNGSFNAGINWLTSADLSSGVTGITNMSAMFTSCNVLTSVIMGDTSTVTNFSMMFTSCTSLTTVSILDTSSGTNFGAMFAACPSLTTIPLFNTSSGTNFGAMFAGCPLTSVPLFDVSNGTDFSSMFQNCSALEVGALLGTGADISYSGCNLSAPAIVDIFNSLKSGVTGKTIDITYNPGADVISAQDRQIAYDKGWDVTYIEPR